MKLSEQVNQVAQNIKHLLPKGASPKVGMVLGSGWGAYGSTLTDSIPLSYRDIGIPVSEVVGHSNRLLYGKKFGVDALIMQGRIHYYEGYDLQTVVLPIRALIACGCNIMILTNAAGGIQKGMFPGQIAVISDHINFLGISPLLGKNDPALGTRFPEMNHAYDRQLQALAHKVGKSLHLRLASGVYAMVSGPQYETPAEIQMLARLGADLTGMSTVPETIAARHMGARVLGLSCVTNLAAGLSEVPPTHEEVTETALRAQRDFVALLDGMMQELSQELL